MVHAMLRWDLHPAKELQIMRVRLLDSREIYPLLDLKENFTIQVEYEAKNPVTGVGICATFSQCTMSALLQPVILI